MQWRLVRKIAGEDSPRNAYAAPMNCNAIDSRYEYSCEERCFERGLAHAKQSNVRKSSTVALLVGLTSFLPSTCASPSKKRSPLGQSEDDYSGENGKIQSSLLSSLNLLDSEL